MDSLSALALGCSQHAGLVSDALGSAVHGRPWRTSKDWLPSEPP